VNTDAPSPPPFRALEEAEARVLGIQTKLHRWATDDSDRRFADLFNLVCDPAVLLVAWRRVKGNKGARTAGVDGQSVYYIQQRRGEEPFLAELRAPEGADVSPAARAGAADPQARQRQAADAGDPDRARPRGASRAQAGVGADLPSRRTFCRARTAFAPTGAPRTRSPRSTCSPAHRTATSGSWKAISRHALTRSTTPRCWRGFVDASPTSGS
jgi:hypothetical protein